jgi:hypothetical protein
MIMAFKKPGVNKPTGTKPVAPASVKKVMEEPMPEPIVEEPKEIIIEPTVKVEPVVEEVEVEEIKPVVEEVKAEDKVKEELKDKAKATKKRTSKKKTTPQSDKNEPQPDKNEPQFFEEVKPKLPNMSLEECVSIMTSKANPTTPEWEEAKKEIEDKVKGIIIDPDATPGEIKMLIAEIDEVLTELKILATNTEARNNGVLEHIEYVRLSNSKGSNSEERKTNGYEAMMNYVTDPDSTTSANLLDLKVYLTNQAEFYNKMINILVDKKNMIITFSGLIKVESQLGSY